MILFFDRCMGKKVPELLRGCGFEVRVHDDFFGQTATDETILAEVGAQGWAFFTCDDHMARTGASQRQTISDHGVACFLLPGTANRPPWHKIRILARHWDLIEETVERTRRPFLCRLHLKGRHQLESLPRARNS